MIIGEECIDGADGRQGEGVGGEEGREAGSGCKINYLKKKKSESEAGRMVQWIKGFLFRPDDLSLIPRTHNRRYLTLKDVL